ncbi:MAG: hypothetical protein FVQ81_06345 [Candidatus Glassbacteria bacterium]|nr:hypothetical protein [Candidatus Glassbacteria bacterium]
MVDMEVLLALQALDLELDKFRQERKDLPAELEELEEAFSQAGSELETRETELKSLQVEIRDAEGKISQLDESQNKYKQQLLTVKTNREYSALLTEIEGVKREKDELEEAVIQKMGQVETVEATIEEGRGSAAEIEKQLNSQRKELAGRLKKLDGEIGKREKKSGKLASKVPGNVLGLYRRIMGSRMSRAVVSVRNGSCAGCFAHIPLQKVADIRIAQRVYTCDHCGRMLYYDDGDNN